MTLFHCVAARIAEPEQAACRTDIKETMAFRIVASAIIVMTGTLRKFLKNASRSCSGYVVFSCLRFASVLLFVRRRVSRTLFSGDRSFARTFVSRNLSTLTFALVARAAR